METCFFLHIKAHKIALLFDKSPTSDKFAMYEIVCGNSSAGRALPCQGKGRGFESRFPLQSSPPWVNL